MANTGTNFTQGNLINTFIGSKIFYTEVMLVNDFIYKIIKCHFKLKLQYSNKKLYYYSIFMHMQSEQNNFNQYEKHLEPVQDVSLIV